MHTIRDIASISNYRPSGGDLLKLFHLAIQQEVGPAEVALSFKSNSYFRKVKKKLKDQLLDGILLNSFSQLSKVQQRHFEIRKRNLEVIMLIQTEKKNTAITIAEETCQNAERYGLVDVAWNMSRELAHHYSVVNPDTVKEKRYREKAKLHFKNLRDEFQAQSLFNQLAFAIQKKRSTQHLKEQLNKLEELALTNDQFKFNLYLFSVKNLYARYTNNALEIIENCRNAAIFFGQSKTILPYTTRWNFKYQMIPLYLNTGRYPDAASVINECLELPAKGSYNWHLTLLYKMVLGFYSQKHIVLLQAWEDSQVTPCKFQDSAPITNRQKIIYGYMAFFARMGKLNFSHNWKTRKSLNDTKAPVTGKVNLLALELLHLLLDGKKKLYMDRVAYIEQYIRDNKLAARPKYFLRMLRAIEIGDYHPIRVKAHAKKHYDLLKKTTSTLNINVLDNEPVPYEVLWGLVMDYFRNKR